MASKDFLHGAIGGRPQAVENTESSGLLWLTVTYLCPGDTINQMLLGTH